MKMKRENFNKAVIAMKDDPTNIENQKEYVKQVDKLSEILLNTHKVDWKEHRDRKQDLLEITVRRDLLNRVEPTQNILSFYWTTLAREIWKQQSKEMRRVDFVQHNDIFPQLMTDHGEGRSKMLKELKFRLEDYTAEEGETLDLDHMPEVYTSKPTRKKTPPIARHWHDLFFLLERKQTLTVNELIDHLPEEKRNNLKDPAKAIKHFMKQVAKVKNKNLAVNKDNIYTVI